MIYRIGSGLLGLLVVGVCTAAIAVPLTVPSADARRHAETMEKLNEIEEKIKIECSNDV